MKLKDFISHLQNFDPELEVVVSVTDPTDYEYKVLINEDSVSVGDPYDTNGYSALTGEESLWSDDYDEDEETGETVYIGPKVLIIDLGIV